ncbi:hypothetical protein GH714_026901 [Hevea brasiliensis]|uniref:Uncharacterized protein n=1 Tax=Hevea brasiliensis TaxID=3981 RepID=A0A6A6M146_HEVBR|nr:hypothetical protein GH714_026901 [Hevea brasiliensis]
MAAFSHPDFVLDPFLQLQKTNTFSSLQEKETITKPSSSQDYRQEIPNLHEISHFADNPEVPSTDTLASPVIVNQHSTSPSFMVDPESGWVHVAPLITPILMEQKRKHVDTWKGSEIESKGKKKENKYKDEAVAISGSWV